MWQHVACSNSPCNLFFPVTSKIETVFVVLDCTNGNECPLLSWLRDDSACYDAVCYELSVCINVGGCAWPSSCIICCTGVTNFALMYSIPNLTSPADDMADLFTCATLWIAPLFEGKVVFFDKKKFPPLCFMLVVHLNRRWCCLLPSHAACMVCDHGFTVCGGII